MGQTSATDKFFARLTAAIADGSFVKLTLGGAREKANPLRNVFVRPVALSTGPHLAFVYRETARDVTKNFRPDEAVARLLELVGAQFRHAHLFTTHGAAELTFREGKTPRLIEGPPVHEVPPSTAHDRAKARALTPGESPWLHGLGVTTPDGRVAKGMEAKFRQIHRFVELLAPLLPTAKSGDTLSLVDLACGKGYLTFAAYEALRRAGFVPRVRGIEARAELVTLCQRVAEERGFDQLRFECGAIADAKLDGAQIILALHACDTATDDALGQAIAADASLIVVSPCCHKELRPQLRPPAPLADALRHGILHDRHAEFVTDALRAALLEWAGYDTKVFEFISTEHTSKNLMITARRRPGAARTKATARVVQDLADFYGIHRQRLATHLGFDLESPLPFPCKP